ncbi:MAG: hypothetical protein JXQ27_09735 [Acidobacteria bacterium]|nr:hypothetical protein [Acidobacteriota bacterium]
MQSASLTDLSNRESPPEMPSAAEGAWVVAVHMGLGHLRAAHGLQNLAHGRLIVYGDDDEFCPAPERRLWKRTKRLYYFLSRAIEFPLIGKALFGFLNKMLMIPPFYPNRDLSRPSWSVRLMTSMIRDFGLGATLIRRIKESGRPSISTFYATALAIDRLVEQKKDNYLVITDTDLNRIWVPEEPERSTIRYLAPCAQVKKRLRSYGIPKQNIYVTGFPLPVSNLGSRQGLEILKEDLFCRLVRLDPRREFHHKHKKEVLRYLERTNWPAAEEEGIFSLTFAVGGAGVQTGLVRQILSSLREKISQNRIRVNLSAGIRTDVRDRFLAYLDDTGLTPYLDERVRIIYHADAIRFFTLFNEAMRTTDVLWTKPSELSFFCGLGIPILIAPHVGHQEKCNARWLQEIHAGLRPPGEARYTNEWLFDLRKRGRLAETAWQGFLNARKLGAYKIEELVRYGRFEAGKKPLEK